MITLHGIDLDCTEKPPMADNQSGTCIVLGSGRCLWEDIGILDDKGIQGVYVGVNFGGMLFPRPIEHLTSLHENFIAPMANMRRVVGPTDSHFHTHSAKHYPGVEIVWPICNSGGTSGLFAAQVALCLGYDRIVLAGMPLDDTGNFYSSTYEKLTSNLKYGDGATHGAWKQVILNNKEFRDKVRSVSGNTQKMLGGV